MIKKFVPYIIIATIFLQLFAFFGVGNNLISKNNIAEAADCVISDENISYPTPHWNDNEFNNTSIPRPDEMKVLIKSTGCKDKYNIVVEVNSTKNAGILNQELKSNRYLITNDTFSFTFKMGEKTCSGTACDHVWFIFDVSDTNNKNETPINKGPLQYQCLGKDLTGAIKCGAGNLDNSWGIRSTSGLSTSSSDVATYTGKYYYTKTTTSLYSVEKTIEKSKPFDYIDSCNIDRETERKNSTVALSVSTNMDIVYSPCQLFNSNNAASGNIKNIDSYSYIVTSKDNSGNTTTEENSFTTIESCQESHDSLKNEADINKAVDLIIGECIKTTTTQIVTGTSNSEDLKKISDLPTCRILFPTKIGGCIAQGIHYLIFKPTSFLFGLTGKALDFAVMYSVSDTSYRSSFVVEGWGVVRDFCNMFFIFVMLYIAFSTILNVGGGKTKEMIINVVIIGLLINFSLFAVQVIIDASNIITRVFYNPQVIVLNSKTDQSDPAKAGSQLGEFGEIKLSEAIVAKVNPQVIISRAKDVNTLQVKSSTVVENEQTTNDGITVGTFILVEILAIVINVIGMIAFMSSALIFITRVIGLWLAMILAPIAFFSYTVPGLQDLDMIGWKKWWPDTIKLAFLAPVFVFFMYLIVKFLDKGLGLIDVTNKTGLNLVIAILVPFIFIMILLMKAKDIAHNMSGEIGKAITKGIAAVGSVALGGAALGVAALGRSTVGSVARNIQNDSARQKDLKFGGVKDQWNNMNKLNPFSYFKLGGKAISGVGKAGTAGIATLVGKIPAGKNAAGSSINTKEKLQQSEKDFGKKDRSQKALDSAAKSEFGGKFGYGDSVKFSELTEPQQIDARKALDKDQIARDHYKASDWKSVKEESDRGIIEHNVNYAYDQYEINKKTNPAVAEATLKSDLNSAGLKKKDSSGEMISAIEASQSLGEFSAALRRGSFDLRNLSKLTTSSKSFAKFGIGLTAILASGIRAGLKSGVDVNYGTGQKDVWKDIGSVLSESLKDLKIEVPKPSSGGGGHRGGDHGGGGGHH